MNVMGLSRCVVCVEVNFRRSSLMVITLNICCGLLKLLLILIIILCLMNLHTLHA